MMAIHAQNFGDAMLRITALGNVRLDTCIALSRRVGWVLTLISALLAFATPPAAAAGNTMIDLTYDSVMDMVRPEMHPGIAVHHSLQVTVSANNKLAEDRNRSTGPYRDQSLIPLRPGTQNVVAARAGPR